MLRYCPTCSIPSRQSEKRADEGQCRKLTHVAAYRRLLALLPIVVGIPAPGNDFLLEDVIHALASIGRGETGLGVVRRVAGGGSLLARRVFGHHLLAGRRAKGAIAASDRVRHAQVIMESQDGSWQVDEGVHEYEGCEPPPHHRRVRGCVQAAEGLGCEMYRSILKLGEGLLDKDVKKPRKVYPGFQQVPCPEIRILGSREANTYRLTEEASVH